MSGDGPGRWLDRLMGWCVGFLVAAIAIYCAVSLIESILPTLMVIVGILVLIAAVVGVGVVISTWRNKW